MFFSGSEMINDDYEWKITRVNNNNNVHKLVENILTIKMVIKLIGVGLFGILSTRVERSSQ